MANAKFAICKVTDWAEFLRLVPILHRSFTLDDKWFFRGQADAAWELLSGYERQNKIAHARNAFHHEILLPDDKNTARMDKNHQDFIIREHRMNNVNVQRQEWMAIQEFKRDASRFIQLDNDIEWLALMQHYGTVTRLMDFTESIFVALYFAFVQDIYTIENSNLQFIPKAVWAVRQLPLWENQTEIKEKYGSRDSTDIKDHSYIFLHHYLLDKYNRMNDCRKVAEAIIEKHAIIQENRGVIPLYPTTNNERMHVQQGMFLFPRSLKHSFMDNLIATLDIDYKGVTNPMSITVPYLLENHDNITGFNMMKFEFCPRHCGIADNILRSANVSAKTLFPDLTGIAKSIKY